MAFCGYCGSQMPDDMNFCTECGKPLVRKNNQSVNPTPNPVPMQTVDSSADSAPFYVDHSYTSEECKNPEEQKASDLYDDLDVDPFNNVGSFGQKINESSDADKWTASGFQSSDSDSLYNTLKSANDKKEKANKKAGLVALVLTILFALAALILIIIKFKPFDGLKESIANAVENMQSADAGEDDSSSVFSTTSSTNSSSGSSSNSSSSTGSSSNHSSSSGSSSSTSSGSSHSSETPKSLRAINMGVYYNPVNQFSDYLYIDFFYDVYNPNETLIAEFPKVTQNLRNSSGAIIATETVGVGLIMPGDTVRIFGTLSVLLSEASTYASDDYSVECRDFSMNGTFYSPIRSDEIVFSNISARSGNYSGTITGEITNKSAYDTGLSQVYAILYKDDEIVGIFDGFTDGVDAGQTRVFEINTFDTIPAYDTIECYADVW